MNRITGGFLTAGIGVGLAVAWFSGAFGPLIASIAALARGAGAPTDTPAMALPPATGSAQPQVA